MVTRLSAADAMALRTQTSTSPAHTVVVIILEACDHFSHARLHRLVASSLPELARFRSRLVSKPLGMGQPVWAEIDDYDATRNIQRASVAATTVHGAAGVSVRASISSAACSHAS